MTVEVTTVGYDIVVLHDGTTVQRFDDLRPDTTYELSGIEVRTAPRPPGELLCRFATVNDVHFGEVVCGMLDASQPTMGPLLQLDDPDGRTHPEVMNAGAVAEIAAIEPAAVIVKGDLTDRGTLAEYEDFLACYGGAFGERMHHVRGNHDAMAGETYADGPGRIDLPGATVALLDTVVPGEDGGTLDDDQLTWLADVATDADRPVLVMSHHYPWSPESRSRPEQYFGIRPDASEHLVDTIARHPSIIGSFAGHSHRNRVRRFAATGDLPYVEVACVKDFPGSWAEYRVHEGGVFQLHHRISTPDALAWSERCRVLYRDFGVDYAPHALAPLDQRCFAFGLH